MTNQNYPPKRRRGDKIAARRGRRHPWWQLWTGIAVLVVALVAGIAIQSARSSSSGSVVTPAHALGPGGGEQRGNASAPVLVEEYGDFQCPLCAGDQGKFWPYHDQLFAQQGPENSGTFSTGKLLSIGRQVGVSDQRFTTCVNKGTYNGWVAKSTDDASRRGVNQTPTVFVDGQAVSTAITATGLQDAVNSALAAK